MVDQRGVGECDAGLLGDHREGPDAAPVLEDDGVVPLALQVLVGPPAQGGRGRADRTERSSIRIRTPASRYRLAHLLDGAAMTAVEDLDVVPRSARTRTCA